MTSRLPVAFVPVSITLPAWEHAVEVFDFSQWGRRQFALIKAAQDAWNWRSDRETQLVTFSLTLFVRLGDETAERTQNFVARYVDDVLVVTLGEPV
ncbi:hypothetical protein [Salmonella enterica]|uniref:Uncharacterized protein n=1 Tax=Salmonella enterica subsp. enterica serovar Weslaco TaxID=1243597 RepID=A0A5X3P0G4_SALET|nr:hypothetical protein [Salmonella enterica]EBP3404251.1 hypothetical protein [Salmonella enterica subsp. enterica]EDX3117044.1 hypothetical protein [Salmonella enterica subsp. enterica serovar Mississippi]EAM2913173.1 hypothetical protein [Salmonella enterica]EAZ0955245.1 hypothetical protein [Salmonella enterica]EBA2366870.1 hypothetical protein [Salmonella enterica]